MGDDDREVELGPLIITAAEVGVDLVKILPSLVQNFTAALQGIADEALEGTNVLLSEKPSILWKKLTNSPP